MPVNKSRLTLARAAVRPQMHGRLMLSGPAGSGKTLTALTVGEVLAGPNGRVLMIDTEKESGLTYADLFTFDHLKWTAPFDPREFAATLLEAGRSYDVVIVDSFSHFWRKEGGTLDIAGGKFTGWKDARPAQEDAIEAILEADAHVVIACRSKMDHAQQVGPDGKITVVKLGMAAQQDDDLEYEVNVSVELDLQHAMSIAKSRTNAVPVGRVFPAGHAPEFATLYRDWLAGGEPVAPRESIDRLVAALDGIEDRGERVKAKQAFVEGFGRPEFILASRLVEAQNWTADRIVAIVEGGGTAVAQLQIVDGGGPGGEAGDAGTPAPPEEPVESSEAVSREDGAAPPPSTENDGGEAEGDGEHTQPNAPPSGPAPVDGAKSRPARGRRTPSDPVREGANVGDGGDPGS